MQLTAREKETYEAVNKWLKENPGQALARAFKPTNTKSFTYRKAKLKTQGIDPDANLKSKKPGRPKSKMQTIVVTTQPQKTVAIVVCAVSELGSTLREIMGQ